MSGKVSDLPIRYKRAVFTQKKLDRINFRSGNGGRVLRNPPGVTRCWSRFFFVLPIQFSVFRQTLSDITLDRSQVKSDKLLCVNTALAYSFSSYWITSSHRTWS